MASAANQTLAFVGTNTNTGDNTVFIDNVRLNAAVPAAVTNLTATAGSMQVALAWNGINGVTGYHMTRSAGGSSTTLQIGAGATSYTDASVVNGITYSYSVSGYNEAGDGANSNVASATPTSPPVSAAEKAAPAIVLTNNADGSKSAGLTVQNSLVGHQYKLQYTDDLAASPWQDVPGIAAQPGTNGVLQFVASASPGIAKRFYRVFIQP